MDVDFRALTTEVRSLAARLMQRCNSAEARVAELEVTVAGQQARIENLEQQLAELTTKYRNLQQGLATGADSEQIAQMKERYLAIVSEIDECISKLKSNG